MKNITKDIPVELDMKILEYASKKKFKSEKSHYFAVLRFAALVAFVVGVCFAFDNFYRSKRQGDRGDLSRSYRRKDKRRRGRTLEGRPVGTKPRSYRTGTAQHGTLCGLHTARDRKRRILYVPTCQKRLGQRKDKMYDHA